MSGRIEEILVVDLLNDVNNKLDKLYMVLMLRSLQSYFDHVYDQILAGDQITSMDSLVTRLLRVPTSLKDENSAEVIQISTMVAS